MTNNLSNQVEIEEPSDDSRRIQENPDEQPLNEW